MLETAFLLALQRAFLAVFALSMALATWSIWHTRRRCLLKTAGAMLAALLVQTLAESLFDVFLPWWGHMAIDLPVFLVVTMPPRHYWQCAIGALVFCQLLAHGLWAVGEGIEHAARLHWLACTVLGLAKCIVLALWSGGPRVETAFDRAAGYLDGLVHRPPAPVGP